VEAIVEHEPVLRLLSEMSHQGCRA
jgi:hypothetical protein